MPGVDRHLHRILIYLRHPPLWVRLGVVVAMSVGFAFVAGPIVKMSPNASWFMRTMAVPLAMLGLVLCVAIRHETKWRRTVGILADVLQQVRDGKSGRAEMARVMRGLADRGELARMADEVERIVKDNVEAHRLRRQAEADADRRVEETADALGRQIGALKTKADRDGLTGLGNRSALDDALPRFVATARRTAANLSAVMIDVDRFKTLNDTLGHAEGDRVLRDFAKLIRSAVRGSDGAYRYGGDEFVLLLADIDHHQARQMADRLSRLADGLAASIRGVPSPPGLSCGVASLSQLTAAATGDDLLKAADRDAYRVKRQRKACRLAA